jgi:hypothetical protein
MNPETSPLHVLKARLAGSDPEPDRQPEAGQRKEHPEHIARYPGSGRIGTGISAKDLMDG